MITPPTTSSLASNASTTDTVHRPAPANRNTPGQDTEATHEAASQAGTSLPPSVAALQAMLDADGMNLQVTFDAELQQPMYSFVSKTTGHVVYQIPSDGILDFARRIKQKVGVLVSEKR